MAESKFSGSRSDGGTGPSSAGEGSMARPKVPIEVDGDYAEADDVDSAFSDSYQTSLSESVTNYTFENGRRYHGFKEGRYMLPNDEDEMDREDMKHHWQLLITNGRLHLAPLGDKPQKILDIGTGTGIWAMQMADDYPSAEIIATDLSPIQPKWVPTNLTFEIDDAEADWVHGPESFDYIHVRFMITGIRDWPKFLNQAYKALKPGGWIEMCDLDCHPVSDDGSLPDPSQTAAFMNHVHEAGLKVGLDTHASGKFAGLARDAGFEDVTSEEFDLPVGGWPKDARLKQAGMFMMVTFRDGLQAIGMGLLTRMLGWSAQEVELFLVGVRKELDDKSVHSYWKLKFTYARKPLAAKA